MFKHWTASLALVCAFGMTAVIAAEKQYGPGANDTEIKLGNTMPYSGPASYSVAQTMVAVLKQCGDNLTRENLMKQAASVNRLPNFARRMPPMAFWEPDKPLGA